MSSINKKVCVIGLGYIGLPTAATLAGRGYDVLGIDVVLNTVNSINAGKVPIVEPELDLLVKAAVTGGKLKAQLGFAVDDKADIFIITVPTPLAENKKPDLQYVQSATEQLAPCLKKGDLVILESTSPVGTTAKIAQWLAVLRPDLSVPVENKSDTYDLAIAYCPERVLPGKILHELIHNDRVIGGLTKSCAQKAHDFYKTFVQGECIKTKARVAAMCKLTENSYRDVNIAFANELSMICDEQGIDVSEVRELANRHPRVNILKPGPGVGGHCIAVDPWFIVDSAPDRAKLIRCAREVNDSKPHYLVKQVEEKLKGLSSPRVLCLGLSYKPNVDDLRESPAVQVVKLLAENSKFQISVCEPHVEILPKELSGFNRVSMCDEKSLDMDIFDYVVKLVEHDVFKDLKIMKIQKEIVV